MKGSSVQTKISNQIKYLNRAGAECKGLFFSSEVNEETKVDNIVFLPVASGNWKWFRHIEYRIKAEKMLNKYLDSNKDNWDLFYIRYPGASKRLYKISRKYGDKVISEHQSKELDEVLSYKEEHKFGLKPSRLLSWLGYFIIPYFSERLYGRKYARAVKAIVTVTDELATYQKAKGVANVLVCPNGIETNRFRLRKSCDYTDTIKILFLKGTASVAKWNGFDRLISSIDKFIDGGSRIELFIIGEKFENELPERSYIKFINYLDAEALNEYFDNVHLGISTLQLYVKNLKEAAVLKSREYFARGLPFIYAYNDKPFDEMDGTFVLKFPNDSSLIDFNKVKNFVLQTSKNKNIPTLMRQFCKAKMDYEKIMSDFYLDLQNISNLKPANA